MANAAFADRGFATTGEVGDGTQILRQLLHLALLIESGRHYSSSRDAKFLMQGIFCLYAARIESHP